jgi:hypothetical protein
MPQQQVDDALAQPASAELIFRHGTPPDAEYTFKHALVQDAAYSTLLRSRRLQLHARIVATLEGQFLEIVETQPELLARHCAEAALMENAVGYWLKARWPISLPPTEASSPPHCPIPVPSKQLGESQSVGRVPSRLGQRLIPSQTRLVDKAEAEQRTRKMHQALHV